MDGLRRDRDRLVVGSGTVGLAARQRQVAHHCLSGARRRVHLHVRPRIELCSQTATVRLMSAAELRGPDRPHFQQKLESAATLPLLRRHTLDAR